MTKLDQKEESLFEQFVEMNIHLEKIEELLERLVEQTKIRISPS